MMKMIKALSLLSFWALITGCATETHFKGDAFIDDAPKSCGRICEKKGLVSSGYIALGEYSDGCLCKAPATSALKKVERISLDGMWTKVNENHRQRHERLVKLKTKVQELQGKEKKSGTAEEASAMVNQLQDVKDSISEISEQDTLALQQLMEEKGKLEEMISNVMKASSDAQNSLESNLKD